MNRVKLFFGMLFFVFTSSASAYDEGRAIDEAASEVSKVCGGAGDHVSIVVGDEDYDYIDYAVVFEKGSAKVSEYIMGDQDDYYLGYEVTDVECFERVDYISDETAILVARAYAHALPENIQEDIETTIEDQIQTVDFKNEDGFNFLMQDKAGNCGFVIVVSTDGSINKKKTYSDWSCI